MYVSNLLLKKNYSSQKTKNIESAIYGDKSSIRAAPVHSNSKYLGASLSVTEDEGQKCLCLISST